MRGACTSAQHRPSHTMKPTYKLPQSVLVVIHTREMQVLLLRRADMGSWQSVTGSKDHAQESYAQTAVREVAEETGVDVNAPGCVMWDWGLENVYDIYPQYWPRYAPGVRRNTEHVFGLQVPDHCPIVLSPTEHTEYRWLPWLQAADEVFSPSNAEAILMLPRQIALRSGDHPDPTGRA
jgi:dihydroneopterin triphosphate diphosphatase